MNDERGDDVQIRVASEWVGLSLRRVLGFGRRVGGGKPSTNENHEPSANGRCANESRFGLGGIVCFDRLSTTPGRVLGFGGRVRGLCEEGASHLTDRRIFVSGRILAIGLTLLSQVRRTRAIASGSGWACPCGGFWVRGACPWGKAVHCQEFRRWQNTGLLSLVLVLASRKISPALQNSPNQPKDYSAPSYHNSPLHPHPRHHKGNS